MLIQSVKETKAMGTCTYVMAWIDPKESLVETLNLGDSGFLLIRPQTESNFEIIFRTKEQQYRFNHPYQCGTNYKPPTNADVHAHIV